MKILWVKTNLLHPLNSGGVIRTYNMLRQLSREHEVTYVALDSATEATSRRRAEEYCLRLIQVPWRGAPRRTQWQFYVQALANLRSDLPLPLERYRVPQLEDALHGLTQRESFDIAVCDFLFPALHFSAVRGTPRLLFQHNVESLIWDRMWKHARGIARPYFRSQAERMRRWEARLAQGFDHVVTVSIEDARLMRKWFGLQNVTSIPTGVDTEYFRPQAGGPERDVVFVGSLDWLPNIDGVRWLLCEVWPIIRNNRPSARLHLVGRRPSRTIRRLTKRTPGIVLWPDVPDVRQHLWRAAAVVVPLRVGGGTRLKIFEALACQKAVVTTTVGAEGLPVANGRHALVASEATDFASAVLTILDDPEQRRRLGEAGRKLVSERYSWRAVADAFAEICRSVVSAEPTRSAT
ncbi:MAG: glycosyltransferase [Gammaproteobacteria bacterium]|uniref:Glycosyltransferase n=1 Tax=Candidatus Kutchimonas denitrificans TaxID=3056748 RepID=A0AAE5C963_9BACT|nr:glycosyltransferase [Gemmatimonadota bacterium]NIR75166.1 glycosyltransferase [Candidatus Kutchimonas denitrificans]NIU52976.1 glycosyltransferase [Gemmatimonadota bacterium]NIV52445.1 glycosyltransferase [Gammaproteobacteria bacterium]NIY44865.1 glycosyltransferase [Gemmatimonadota bacterium]